MAQALAERTPSHEWVAEDRSKPTTPVLMRRAGQAHGSRDHLPSVLSLAVAVVVGVATVLAFYSTHRSVQSQDQALLRNDTTQASEYVASVVGNLNTTLQALASEVTLSGGSAAAFAAGAKPLVGPSLTLALIERTPRRPVVLAAAGSLVRPGQVLDSATATFLFKSGPTLSAGPVNYNGKITSFELGIGPPAVPAGLAILARLEINPFLGRTATEGAPFLVLRAAVYGTHQPRTGQLVLANTRSLPITGPVVEAPISIGSTRWWLVAAAKSPLAGSFPNAAPMVILIVGLLLALATGGIVEVLVRRQRFATRLVAEREAELDEAHQVMIRDERLSTLGEMASMIGHELRNPLAAVINAHFLVRHELGDEIPSDAAYHLSLAERQAQRAVNLTNNIMSFAAQREPLLSECELAVLIDDVLEVTPPAPDVRLEKHIAEIRFLADPDQLGQVLSNLIANAYQALPDGGTVRITGEGGDGRLVIRIDDTGPGIPDHHLDRILDPFFTTKTRGTGLGLAIVDRIVQAHHGGLRIENRTGGGIAATVWLPLHCVPHDCDRL